MAKIIWTDRAINDLESIGDYISKDSINYASITVSKLYNSVEILKKMPQTGRVVPELNQVNVRELIKGNYRIIYLLKDEFTIVILTIHHSARILHLEFI